jgi:16S rRNA (cytidine1402-2'-O)-methyltransferase
MSGHLYLCATPIGNLKDITLRCLETLKAVQLILAEDTRQTRKLLNHYEIETPLKSFHEHNEYHQTDALIQQLKAGQHIALVSDAGLPLISDPGAHLVQELAKAGLAFTCIPGASAPPTALLLSGLPPLPYTFLGFLPRQRNQRQQLLQQYRQEKGTLVCFESPHRLTQALQDIQEVLGDRQAAVCRELTKRYEDVQRGPLSALYAHFNATPARGEITLVLSGALEVDQPALQSAEDLKGRYTELLDQGWHKKAIFQQLREESQLSRNDLYSLLHDV